MKTQTKTYLTNSGTLYARVLNNRQGVVTLVLKFGNQESKIKTVTEDSFVNLDKWVDENYGIF